MNSVDDPSMTSEEYLHFQKVWLQKEMNQLLEAMFDQLKNRFCKLSTEICKTDLRGGCGNSFLPDYNPSATVPAQSIPQQPEIFAEHTQMLSGFLYDPQIIFQVNNNSNNKSEVDFQLVKKEIVDENNVLSDQIDLLFETVDKSEQTSESIQGITTSSDFTSSNEDTSSNIDNFDTHVEIESDNIHDTCDCAKCIDPTTLVKQEDLCEHLQIGADLIGQVELSNPSEESVAISVKKMKLDDCNSGQDTYMDALTDDDQSGNDNLMVTLQLKCPMDGCNSKHDSKAALELHMFDSHQMLAHGCILSGCYQSFHTSEQLLEHVDQMHPQSQWTCCKCDRKWPQYCQLYYHVWQCHCEGIFQCAQPHCTFIGTTRQEVFDHHEQHQRFVCQHGGCGKSFKQSHHLKAHERIHLGVKPYRCKWAACGYASEDRSNTIRHIRGKHLNLPQTVKEQMARHILDARDPKHYLEVVNELLN